MQVLHTLEEREVYRLPLVVACENLTEAHKVLPEPIGPFSEFQPGGDHSGEPLHAVGPPMLVRSPKLNLDQAPPVAVDEMECSIAVGLWVIDIVPKPRDRPVPAETTGHLVCSNLIRQDRSHAADIGHARELQLRLSLQLVGDRRRFLEPLGNNWFACLRT